MKNLFKYLIVYFIGLLFVFTVIWRYDNLNYTSKNTAYNYSNNLINE